MGSIFRHISNLTNIHVLVLMILDQIIRFVSIQCVCLPVCVESNVIMMSKRMEVGINMKKCNVIPMIILILMIVGKSLKTMKRHTISAEMNRKIARLVSSVSFGKI